MQSEEFITAGEFCAHYHVEYSFINYLHDSGLIGLTVRDGAAFLPAVELPLLEKFVRWHYELAINPEGIEAISHLLGRLSSLQEENQALRNRLERFESRERGPAEPAEEI